MRELRADPKNMIFPVVLCGGLACLLVGLSVTHGTTSRLPQLGIIVLGLFVMLSFVMMAHRLRVYDDRIVVWSFFWQRTISLEHVVTSQLAVSTRNPVTLALYDRQPTERTRPIATIALKPFKRSDITWLLQHPRLKANE